MNNYRVKVINKIDQTFQDEWVELWENTENANIYNSLEWFKMSISNKNKSDYEIYACYEDERLTAVLPLVTSRHFGVKIKSPLMTHHIANTPFLLKNTDPKIIKFFLGEIMKRCNFYFPNVDIEDVKSIKKVFPSVFFTLISVNPFIDLRDDPLRFLSKDNIYKRRRTIRKFLDHLSFKTFNHNDDLNKCLEEMFKIDVKSGKKLQSKDIFSNKNMQADYQNMIRHLYKYIHICFLYYDNIPISYVFSFIFKHKFLNYQTSYLNEYRKIAPGKLILVYLLESLKDSGLNMFDFCGGISSFKQEFAPEYYIQYNLLYSNNPIFMLWWKLINRARRLKQILFPEKYTRDSEFLFKEFNNKIN